MGGADPSIVPAGARWTQHSTLRLGMPCSSASSRHPRSQTRPSAVAATGAGGTSVAVTSVDARPRLDVRAVGWLAVFVGVALGAGALGALSTDPDWYRTLNRPSWAPPSWLFAPVWTALYVCMGAAAFWVWRVRGWSGGRVPLGLYAAQLALNAAWTPIFFGLREPAWALAELGLLWVVLLATVAAFARVRIGAAALLVPYLGWVTFAGLLNWQIVTLR